MVLTRRFVAYLILTLCSMTAFAQSAGAKSDSSASSAAFTLAQIMSSPFPSELVAQPNGQRIAWAVSAKGVRNLWIADGPSFAARQVTHYTEDDGGQILSVRLTPNGKTVVY